MDETVVADLENKLKLFQQIGDDLVTMISEVSIGSGDPERKSTLRTLRDEAVSSIGESGTKVEDFIKMLKQ